MKQEWYINHIFGDPVEDYKKQSGHWIVCNFETNMGWPDNDLIIETEGKQLLILGLGPERNKLPAIGYLLQEDENIKDIRFFLNQLLSRLTWATGSHFRFEGYTGGSFPIRTINNKAYTVGTYGFQISYLPQNLNQEALLALALFRDGQSLYNIHEGYSFLSFYKIINLVKKTGKQQKSWVKKNINRLNATHQKRINEIQNDGTAIDEYLYESCRCAVAHAGIDPTINPDNPEDSIRLQKDLPIIRALSKVMIKDHYNIQTRSDVYNDHLYELAGFKEIINDSILDKIKNNELVSRRELEWDTRISIRLWCDKRYNLLEGLNVKTKKINEGIVELQAYSDDNLFSIPVYLDFNQERLYIDYENPRLPKPLNKIATNHIIIWKTFFQELICNGIIEVWKTDEQYLLGRKDPLEPINVAIDKTCEVLSSQIEELEKIRDSYI